MRRGYFITRDRLNQEARVWSKGVGHEKRKEERDARGIGDELLGSTQ